MSQPRYRNAEPTFCKVFVGNLGDSATQHELEEAFSCYGSLRNVWIARNPPGFAFVEFLEPNDALDAIEALNGSILCGCRVRVELAHTNFRSSNRRPPSPERCFACGQMGHYARDCYQQQGEDDVFVLYDLPRGDISESWLDPDVYEDCDWNSVMEYIGVQPRTYNQRNRHDGSTTTNYREPSNAPSQSTAQLQYSNDRSWQSNLFHNSPLQQIWFDSPPQQRGDSRPPQQNRSNRPQQRNLGDRPQQRDQQRDLSDRPPPRRDDRPQQQNRSDRSQQQHTGDSIPSHSSDSSKRNNASDDIKCAICLDTEDDPEMEYIRCGHGFHAKCCHDWLSVKGICPVCRTSVTSQNDNLQRNPERNIDDVPTLGMGSILFI